ncbi:MAG TPA: neutral zinc metallopeptidase [Prolixibacteraceae bacterium]|nr:neutral zinc metallopeptidase [Prolixibacteraceae bacterium]
MLFKGRRQSDNVEDRRGGSGMRTGVIGGGIGTVILVILGLIFNVDISGFLPSGETVEQTTSTGAPELTAEQQEFTEFVSVALGYTEDVWNQLFTESGLKYREPKLVLFNSAINSACGYAQSATGPFYCPGDEKVYLDLDYLQLLQKKLGANGDFAVTYIIAHEVGHHVQKLLGTMDQVRQAQAAASSQEMVNEYTVRLELQADFLAGVFIHWGQKQNKFLEPGDLEEALNAAAAVGDDRIQMKTQGYVVPDSFTHGTSDQRRKWLKKGMDTGDYSQGDTFARNVVL